MYLLKWKIKSIVWDCSQSLSGSKQYFLKLTTAFFLKQLWILCSYWAQNWLVIDIVLMNIFHKSFWHTKSNKNFPCHKMKDCLQTSKCKFSSTSVRSICMEVCDAQRSTEMAAALYQLFATASDSPTTAENSLKFFVQSCNDKFQWYLALVWKVKAELCEGNL